MAGSGSTNRLSLGTAPGGYGYGYSDSGSVGGSGSGNGGLGVIDEMGGRPRRGSFSVSTSSRICANLEEYVLIDESFIVGITSDVWNVSFCTTAH